MPGNNYTMQYECNEEKMLAKNFVNPQCERWELRRVWVVEATLKEGKRHMLSKRRYYLDEDTFVGGMYEGYDHAGQLTRTAFMYDAPAYDQKAAYVGVNAIYDFSKGIYAVNAISQNVQFLDKPRTDREIGPDALAGSGIR